MVAEGFPVLGQKLQGHLQLRSSFRDCTILLISPSKQVIRQVQIQGWENTLHLLIEEVTKNLWPFVVVIYYDGCVHELVMLKVRHFQCLVSPFILPFLEAAANHTAPFPPHSQKGAALTHRESKDHHPAISASGRLTWELLSICTQTHLQKRSSPLPTPTRHFLYILADSFS